MTTTHNAQKTNADDDYLVLLEGLINVSESIKGTQAKRGEWDIHAEALLLKTVFHAASVHFLTHGTKLPSINADFLDPGSIQVLTRATLESVLVFHHVFALPETEDERDLRYTMWCLSGFLTRQRYTPLSSWGKQRQQEEAKLIEELRSKILQSELFKDFPRKQQKKTLERGEWRIPQINSKGSYSFPSWVQIAIGAGLSQRTAFEWYSYLSSYAHSSYLSVLQLRQAADIRQPGLLIGGTTGMVKIAMALMVRLYTKVFPESKSVLDSNERFTCAVDTWFSIGSGALENEEIDWDAEFDNRLSELE